MSAPPSIKLNTGVLMPVVGLGTLQGTLDETDDRNTFLAKNAVLEAIKLGYRHLDTAWLYGSEKALGQAVRESGIPREEFFIVSKLWNVHHDKVQEAVDLSLKNLDVGYIDCYLMHWPVAWDGDSANPFPENADGSRKLNTKVNFVDTWKVMEKLDKSKIKSIGVSNFSQKILEKLLPEATIIPALNQIELHPLLQQPELKAYCDSKGIVITAYSPLGGSAQESAGVLTNDTVTSIAKKHNISPGQVVISWIVGRGDSVIPKTTNPQRLRDNFAVTKLDAEDMAAMTKLDRNARILPGACDPKEGINGWTWEEMGWSY